ncbi:MAG: protein tyrosine phosphatase family protein [Cocleimonas sp.]
MAVDDILNYIKISEKISTSGQPSPLKFQAIANSGFTTVINLAMPDSDDALPDEGGLVTEAGMNYFHIPVPFDAPNRQHLSLFLKLMKSVDGEKVWVHCALNMRVSAFMQHYQRGVLKRTKAEMVPLIESWEPEEVWRDFLKLYNAK